MSELIRVSMRQQIYDIIKKRILSQEYDLGAPINIVALSKELSISNTPIREAVSMLCEMCIRDSLRIICFSN